MIIISNLYDLQPFITREDEYYVNDDIFISHLFEIDKPLKTGDIFTDKKIISRYSIDAVNIISTNVIACDNLNVVYNLDAEQIKCNKIKALNITIHGGNIWASSLNCGSLNILTGEIHVEYIKCRHLFGSGYVYSDVIKAESILSTNMEIKCKYFETYGLPYDCVYYIELEPFKKIKEEFYKLENNNDEIFLYRTFMDTSKKDAIKICSWRGWHPIDRAQLQMFFKLKKRHYLK